MTAETLPLFVYGSLCDPRVRRAVLGHEAADLEPAVLEGYRRVWLLGFGYPFIVPSLGSAVEGLLLFGLSAQDYDRLDEYEGVALGEYRRAVVEVTLRATGRPVRAYAYLVGPLFAAQLDRERAAGSDPGCGTMSLVGVGSAAPTSTQRTLDDAHAGGPGGHLALHHLQP